MAAGNGGGFIKTAERHRLCQKRGSGESNKKSHPAAPRGQMAFKGIMFVYRKC